MYLLLEDNICICSSYMGTKGTYSLVSAIHQLSHGIYKELVYTFTRANLYS